MTSTYRIDPLSTRAFQWLSRESAGSNRTAANRLARRSRLSYQSGSPPGGASLVQAASTASQVIRWNSSWARLKFRLQGASDESINTAAPKSPRAQAADESPSVSLGRGS